MNCIINSLNYFMETVTNLSCKDYYAVKNNKVTKCTLNIFQRATRKLFGAYSDTHAQTAVKQLYPLTLKLDNINPEDRKNVLNFILKYGESTELKETGLVCSNGILRYNFFDDVDRVFDKYTDESGRNIFSKAFEEQWKELQGIILTLSKVFSLTACKFYIIPINENHFLINTDYVNIENIVLNKSIDPFTTYTQLTQAGLREEELNDIELRAIECLDSIFNHFKDILSTTMFEFSPSLPTFYLKSTQNGDFSRWGWTLEQNIVVDNEPAYLYKFNLESYERISYFSLAFGLCGNVTPPSVNVKSARSS